VLSLTADSKFVIDILWAVGFLFIAYFAGKTMNGWIGVVLYTVLAAVFASMLAYFYIRFSTAPKINLEELATATFAYAASMFVFVSEIVRRGGGAALTKWRGETWIKELDYLYLGLGSVGLLLAINRLDSIAQRVSVPDFYGPFIIATALVIRAIKTRAEINGWHEN